MLCEEIMFDNSIITKTKQMWKLKLTFLLAIVGGLALFYGIYMINKDGKPDVVVPFMLGGIVLALGSLVFGSLSVRCPKCKTRWLWEAISKKSSNNWLAWLMAQPVCPSCNYEIRNT